MTEQRKIVEPEALRVPATAAALGISETACWGLISSGQLESFRLGRARLVSRRAITRLIEERERAAAGDLVPAR